VADFLVTPTVLGLSVPFSFTYILFSYFSFISPISFFFFYLLFILLFLLFIFSHLHLLYFLLTLLLLLLFLSSLTFTFSSCDRKGAVVALDPSTGAVLASVPGVSDSWGKPTWRVALDHKLSEDVLVYASYNRGFKGGAYSASSPLDAAVKPETLDAFEVGEKAGHDEHRDERDLHGCLLVQAYPCFSFHSAFIRA